MRVIYFAWLRERTGRSEEDLEFPDEVETVGDAIAYLAAFDEEHAAAFAEPAAVRAALDKHVVDHDAPIRDAREIAFFPPMTGG